MADILIRGMEMPTEQRTEVLIFKNGFVAFYDVYGRYVGEAKAIPLPEGHGRCIDADSFKIDCLAATKEAKPDFIRHEDWLKSCAITMSFCSDIDERPTIVPADVPDIDVGNKKEGGNADA